MQNSLQNHIANGMRQDATYKLVSGLVDIISGIFFKFASILRL